MKQTLHIFKKDLRMFYPEVLISLAITAVFAKIYPVSWSAAPRLGAMDWIPELTAALVPVSWWLLIARVVHAENLVGERQFWITRPYRWPKLLAAKVLFIGIFVYVPFLIALCVLLKEAGFHPFAYLPGLFFNLAMATGIIVLPLMALAVITSNFAKMSLSILIVGVYVALMAYLDSLLPTASLTIGYSDQLSFAVLVCLIGAIIVVQYATRKTLFSRLLLCALAVTITLLGMFGFDEAALPLTYPVAAATQPDALRLSFETPFPKSAEMQFEGDSTAREVDMTFPLSISGVQPGTITTVDGARVKISTAAGETWQSHWQATYNIRWLPGQTSGSVSLKVDRAFAEHYKAQPVAVELSLAMSELRSGKPTRMVLQQNRFQIPGGGICGKLGYSLSCRVPLRQPPLMMVTTRFTKGNCLVQHMPDGDAGLSWIGTLDTAPADFGLTSVWTTSISFVALSAPGMQEGRQYLCPGSPIEFTPFTLVKQRQQVVDAPAVRLQDLATTQI